MQQPGHSPPPVPSEPLPLRELEEGLGTRRKSSRGGVDLQQLAAAGARRSVSQKAALVAAQAGQPGASAIGPPNTNTAVPRRSIAQRAVSIQDAPNGSSDYDFTGSDELHVTNELLTSILSIDSDKVAPFETAQGRFRHWYTLTFTDTKLEEKYAHFFFEKFITTWRRTVVFAILVFIGYYTWSMVRVSEPGATYLDTGTSTCDSVYTAASESLGTNTGLISNDPFQLRFANTCRTYSLQWDLVMLFVTCLAPLSIALIVSHNENMMRKRFHIISGATIVAVSVFNLSFDQFGNGTRDPMRIALPVILFSFAAHMFMRVRFVHTVCIMLVISACFALLVTVNQFSVTNNENSDIVVFSIIYNLISMLLVSFISYETELFLRSQFLEADRMDQNNIKLKDQLRGLQRSYGDSIADFDSPLEKANNYLRYMMADPAMPDSHLTVLSKVVDLLHSSNLMAPDLENQVKKGQVKIDFDTEEWLFSILANRDTRQKLAGNEKGTTATGSTAALNISKTVIATDQSNDATNRVATVMMGGATGEAIDQHLYHQFLDSVECSQTHYETQVTPLLERVDGWNFPVFELAAQSNDHALLVMGHHLLYRGQLIRQFGINGERLINYLRVIELGYHNSNPYHNRNHACDVLQTAHFFLNNATIRPMTNDLDRLAVYLASLVHDFDHPGLGNNFLIATRATKALLYNDKSVLENHHVAASFLVLEDPNNNFVATLPKKDFKHFRATIIELVLATDLTFHYTIMSDFKLRMEKNATFKQADEQLLLQKMIIKCADVSNPTKERSIYHKWIALIFEEFYRQGDEEKRLGLPVSAFMDRNSAKVAQSQCSFIEFICQPLYDAFHTFARIDAQMEILKSNRDYWKARRVEEESAEEANRRANPVNTIEPSKS